MNNNMICPIIRIVLWIQCREIGTKILSDLTNVYAKIHPGILYGMIYNN